MNINMQQIEERPVEYTTIPLSYNSEFVKCNRNRKTVCDCDTICDQSHISQSTLENYCDDDNSAIYSEYQQSFTRTYDSGYDSKNADLTADMTSNDGISIDLDNIALLHKALPNNTNTMSLNQRTNIMKQCPIPAQNKYLKRSVSYESDKTVPTFASTNISSGSTFSTHSERICELKHKLRAIESKYQRNESKVINTPTHRRFSIKTSDGLLITTEVILEGVCICITAALFYLLFVLYSDVISSFI